MEVDMLLKNQVKLVLFPVLTYVDLCQGLSIAWITWRRILTGLKKN
jgi:hypothetical protein